MCSGKSTLARLLAKELGIPFIELDELRDEYYPKAGYDKELAAKIAAEKGMMGIIQYWKPFEVYAVEQVIEEHRGSVISFGAGHSVHEDESLFTRVKNSLKTVDYVFLLLPSPDLSLSVKILNERFSELLEREVGDIDPELLRLNEHFVRHMSNRRLASQVIYTGDQTPDETCKRILDCLQKPERQKS